VSDATWLPNLVGGTSIWKLAVDLNEAKFFDGRLLVPETEGSESLPVTVRWDLTGLVPLKEARAKYPDDTASAALEFSGCLERVAKIFATPNSGFDKYKDAFTVPSLDADENYFYSPDKKKLFVINWGASPRSMGGKAEYVFGYEDWGKQWGALGAPAAAPAPVARAGVVAAAAVAAAAANPEEKKEDKKDEKKKEEKGRPWWIWPLFGLVVIALILLALYLLKTCDEQKTGANADASADALAEGATSADGSAGGLDGASSADGAASDPGADAATADGGADAASTDGGHDAGKDAGKDGGHAGGDDDDDDDGTLTLSSGGGGGGGGGGASGGPVVVKVGPGGGAKTPVHRKHYSDDAVKWRVTSGAKKVSRTEDAGKRFDVWLGPGQTFEGVKVEWQDKAGKWHPH
jgi:hypothetical protein